jgi:RHH-type proline utilization regulon transcriptional repressor/proline dehydrogenase/delta 1-pyrroline-5-carboxylate dehydrogenase
MRLGVFVNLDMEQNDLRPMTLTLAEELFSEPEFSAYPHLGIVIQAYLKSSLDDLKSVYAFAAKRKAPLTVRLVKGAYWDFEVIQSLQKDWPIPVFTDKAMTDANYEVCADFLLSHYPVLHSAFGSHNVRNLAFCMARAEKLGLAKHGL